MLVGITPVADQASVFIAIDQGFFEDEGLEVTAQPAQGGAAAVPAMIAGDMQAAFATYPSFLLAQSGGVGINIVAEGVRGNEESNGVYVKADSGINSIEDLEGKKVAVNTLKNTGELTIKVLMEEAGMDVSKVEFLELPFPIWCRRCSPAASMRCGWSAVPDRRKRSRCQEAFRELLRPDRGRSALRPRHDRRVRQGEPEHDRCVHPCA